MIILGMAFIHLALASSAILRRDRGLFLIWAAFSILSTVIVLALYPIVGILKLVALLLGARLVIAQYNAIVLLSQNADATFHDVSVAQLRRQSIIPRLEAFTARYCGHERGTLLGTTQARGRAANLLALVEQYPALHANQTFTQLMNALVHSEDEIRSARLRHNEIVRNFNTEVTRFPNLLIARALGFAPRQYLPQWL